MSDKYVIYYLQTRACVGRVDRGNATSYFAGGKVWSNQFEQMTESLGWTETFPLLYLWSCLQRRLRQATSYSKLLQITWSDLMLDWCLRQSTSHRVSVVYHSYGGMVDMWHRNICWSIWALIYSIAGQRQDGHHHRRIQQEEVVWSVVSSCVFLFAWQVIAVPGLSMMHCKHPDTVLCQWTD